MKNIIFDVGNVLLSFHPHEYLSQYYDEDTVCDLMTYIFSDDEWLELDLGNMMIKDAIASLTSKHPDYTDKITFVLQNWTDMLEPIQEHIDILYLLKEKGYNLYLLSNFHKEAFEMMKEKYDFLNIFDGYVVSGFEHIIKPQKEIYERLVHRYDLKKEDCLFIDDMLGNIYASENLGIQGLYLGYHVDLKQELIKKGIL